MLTAEIPYSDKPTVTIPAPFLNYFTFANNKEQDNKPEPMIAAHLIDGSILYLIQLQSGEDSTLEGEMTSGYAIEIPTEAVAKLSFEMDETTDDENGGE